MDAVLRTHAIDPSLLRCDDFHGFYAHRKQALLTLTGQAMGKAVQQAESNAPVAVGAYEEDEEEAQAA